MEAWDPLGDRRSGALPAWPDRKKDRRSGLFSTAELGCVSALLAGRGGTHPSDVECVPEGLALARGDARAVSQWIARARSFLAATIPRPNDEMADLAGPAQHRSRTAVDDHRRRL